MVCENQSHISSEQRDSGILSSCGDTKRRWPDLNRESLCVWTSSCAKLGLSTQIALCEHDCSPSSCTFFARHSVAHACPVWLQIHSESSRASRISPLTAHDDRGARLAVWRRSAAGDHPETTGLPRQGASWNAAIGWVTSRGSRIAGDDIHEKTDKSDDLTQ